MTAPDLPAAVEAALRLAALTEAMVAHGSWPYIDGYSRDHGLADAATVRSALSALRQAQGEAVADIDDDDVATVRLKYQRALDENDRLCAALRDAEAPPPPVDVPAWLEARASALDAAADAGSGSDGMSLSEKQAASDAAACRRAAAAYRREFGGGK